jgi:hypothetical protein
MQPRKPYTKPEITLFDLNVEPLDAACCETENNFALTKAGRPFCNPLCCEIIEASG